MNPMLLLVQKYRWESLFESIYPEFGSHFVAHFFSMDKYGESLIYIEAYTLSLSIISRAPFTSLLYLIWFLGPDRYGGRLDYKKDNDHIETGLISR